MKKYLFFLFLFCAASVYGQSYIPRVINNLPPVLAEASGAIFRGKYIFINNDGNGSTNNFIYRIDQAASLTRTITISGAKNKDWEALATNNKMDTLYICDIGDNGLNRSTYNIYVCQFPVNETTVASKIINFTYPDNKKWNAESACFDERTKSILIFTKNAVCHVFSVPVVISTPQVATLVDTFTIQGVPTDATIKNDTLILLGYNKLNIYIRGVDNKFSLGYHKMISIKPTIQREGISFIDLKSIYIVSENVGSLRGVLETLIIPY